jgi:ferredoxin
MVKELDLPSYQVDCKALKRFDERQNVFGRMLHDEKASFYQTGMYENVARIIAKKESGYSRLEFARTLGAWTAYDYFHGAFSWELLSQANSVMTKPALEKYAVSEPSIMTEQIKETATLYGASLTGICKLDNRWIYSRDMAGKTIEIPRDYRYAVVMAIQMDVEAIETSPSFSACTASALGYSKMAFCVACLAEFIRRLGYKAIPMGNDTALSIPLAIDAGLGQLGRNGLLITPQYGPCVRICKVFTDLPLEPDRPIEFGVTDFCKRCNKCAKACEVDAIQSDKEPSFKVECPSNNQGILRWAVNHDKCYPFWIENGGDCSTCIAVCPFVRRAGKG